MGDDDKALTAEDVKAIVAEVMAGAQPKSAAPKAAAAGDVTAQVEAAVAKVRAGDAAAAEQKSLSDRLAALEAGKAKPEPEKQPKTYRKITSFLWGNDDDD
ncbi:hypothetical protein [Kitasatospora sp. NPDC057198]|uniref:hypothetical protein n=1 Tax=Kitasatospora sp. NPDC057198 TaxID=3346046 RepID=UPI00362BF581